MSVDILGTSCDQCRSTVHYDKSLRPRKPEGSLGRTAQDVYLDFHTAPELWCSQDSCYFLYPLTAWLLQLRVSSVTGTPNSVTCCKTQSFSSVATPLSDATTRIQHLTWKNCTGLPFQNVLIIKSLYVFHAAMTVLILLTSLNCYWHVYTPSRTLCFLTSHTRTLKIQQYRQTEDGS